MLRGISNILVPSISHFTAQSGRMSLPVDSSSLLYSNFQYVRGTPAPEGTNGVPISRLNLLDVLIGRINQLNKASLSSARETGDGSGQQFAPDLDDLIESYRVQLQEAQAASAAMPYLPSPNTQPGTVFSLLG